MNPTDAAFAKAKNIQKMPEAAQKEIVDKGFDMVKEHLLKLRDLPEFQDFVTLEGTREKLKDPTIERSALDQWIHILDLSAEESCCLGHRVETLSDLGKHCLVTATLCEQSDCDDEPTHKFLRHFSDGILDALNYMNAQLSPSYRN